MIWLKGNIYYRCLTPEETYFTTLYLTKKKQVQTATQ